MVMSEKLSMLKHESDFFATKAFFMVSQNLGTKKKKSFMIQMHNEKKC
jgi:hypothetical protein